MKKRREKHGKPPHILSFLFSIQRWWPAHSPTTWACTTVKPALHGYAEQRAASLLSPHDPDIWLRLLHQWRNTRGCADQAAQLSGASYCRRASPWHLSDFLQWAHIQRHWGLGSGWWESHIQIIIMNQSFTGYLNIACLKYLNSLKKMSTITSTFL